MVNESTDPIHRFATLLRQEWASLDARHQAALDTEDLLDIFWLANQIQPAPQTATATQVEGGNVTVQQGQNIAAPPSASTSSESKAGVYLPPPLPSSEQADQRPGLGAGISLQVPAANALRSQLEFARAMRPLMQKIASPTQRQLDEEATAIQIAEQQIWSPVLVPAPERWFDLAIVIEDSASLQIWEDTIVEFKALVEQQGAFRQIRTWRLKGNGNSKLQLSLNWQPGSVSASDRPAEALLDPTGRRMIWVVSDCTSDLWDAPQIYHWLEKWGKQSPLAIVQWFPERLWPRTALGIGEPMYLQAGVPGATQARLSQGARAVYPEMEEIEEEQGAGEQEEKGEQESGGGSQEAGGGSQESGGAGNRSIILPVISLEPEPLSRWVKVTMGAGDAVVAGLKIDLNRLTPQVVAESIQALTPEQQLHQLRQFCATASITAQKLAGLMAAVPVSLPVVHLIQQVLLPQSQQVHVAEVLMSGLLEVISPLPNPSPDRLPNQPSPDRLPNQPRRFLQFRFAEAVREALIDAVPISKTTQVLDTVSAYISERLGLGTRSFTALIATLPQLEAAKQQEVQPFAELALSTLRRLGGDYRTQADRLAPYLNPSPSEPTPQDWPPLQEHRYQVVTVELEPLQRFEFETAIIEQQRRGIFRRQSWVITKSPGYGWQRVEDLGKGVQLELVEIIGGSFQMGSPKDEPERYEDEDPQHEVRLKDFFIGKYPIMQVQWKAVAALPQVDRELDPDLSNFKGENRPVENVSWHDAVEFCARLSAKTGRQYDLPTEAEWEYACRAGTTTPFHFGEMITPDLANYDGSYNYNNGPKGANRGETTPIASFPANSWGLYDMHGNVWEWCADHWHGNYADKPEALKQNGNVPWRSDDENANRSLRGGSWFSVPWFCRSAIRGSNAPDVRNGSNGFRVVCRAARALQ